MNLQIRKSESFGSDFFAVLLNVRLSRTRLLAVKCRGARVVNCSEFFPKRTSALPKKCPNSTNLQKALAFFGVLLYNILYSIMLKIISVKRG